MLDRQLFEVEGFRGNRGRLLRPAQQLSERCDRAPDRHTDHALGGVSRSRLAARTATRAGSRFRRISSSHRPDPGVSSSTRSTAGALGPSRRAGGAAGADHRLRGASAAVPAKGDRAGFTPRGRDADPSQLEGDIRPAERSSTGNSPSPTAWSPLDPKDAAARRERGHVHARLECYQAAYHDYLHYLRLAPSAKDAAEVRERIDRLRPIATRLN